MCWGQWIGIRKGSAEGIFSHHDATAGTTNYLSSILRAGLRASKSIINLSDIIPQILQTLSDGLG